MTTNRVRLVGGAILTGALLLGTAGLALAQGMTGRSSMMDGLTMVGSINGAMGTMHGSMTADQLKAMGTMHGSMTADQLKAMGTMHGSMTTRGVDNARGR